MTPAVFKTVGAEFTSRGGFDSCHLRQSSCSGSRMDVTVYVLRSKVNGKRYVGITSDLSERLDHHRAKYTKAGQILGEFEVIHTEEFSSYSDARKREKFLKSGPGRRWLDKQFGTVARHRRVN